MAEQTVRLDPVPSILVESLRDIGYSLNSALADVIDNSIAANATEVQIFAIPGDDFRIAIIDNGEGLRREELKQAMRLGSSDPRQERELNDLGRFGLGLKTASFSQCRRLTVLSRKGGEKAAAFIWDLDFISRENQWNLIEELDLEAIPFADKMGGAGTLVLWEKLDRLTGVRGSGKIDYDRILSEAGNYLGLVFHRYLLAEKGLKKLAIRLNGRALVPIDPFNISHPATQIGQSEVICPGVVMQAFTLPHRSHYDSEQEFDYFGLPGGYLKNQGVYLYRAKRLIMYGTWFGLSKKTALTQLSRVKIDIALNQDEVWKIDVKKVSAEMPEKVRERIRMLIRSIGAPSRRVYRRRATRLTSDEQFPAWVVDKVGDKNLYRINRDHPSVRHLRELLDSKDTSQLDAALRFIEAQLPVESLFYDFAKDNETPVVLARYEDEEFANLARTFFAVLKQSGDSEEQVLSIMRQSDPFKSEWIKTLSSLGIEEEL